MSQREKEFWNKEYKDGEHFNLSMNPSGELLVFEKWIQKELGPDIFNVSSVLDIGCGNGRNLVYLNQEHRTKGFGFDISDVAIKQAMTQAHPKSTLQFFVHDLRQPFTAIADGSIDIVLDLMVSHHLNKEEHAIYMQEILRVLAPDGWILWKTFLKDGDTHTKRMMEETKKKNQKVADDGMYIHPEFGIKEYVWREQELRDYVEPYFTIEHLRRSHNFGRGNKRRYMVAYLSRK